ncbi:MAG TPA: M56 family metallopeptidase [Puia sp.]|nr:M56 family metallopeptidase [Puia sp.]
MHLLDQSTLLNVLGWMLFNSLWQMAFLWLVYIIVTGGGKNFSANARHSFALFLLGTGTAWFIFSLIANCFNGNFSQESLVSFNIISNSRLSFLVSCKQFINFLLPYCSFAYLIAIVVLVIKYSRYYISSQHLKQNGLQKAPIDLRIFTEDIAARIGIHKKVKLWLSSAIKSPMTIGFFKPVILIPLATINHLNTQQIEAVLLHELAHIKRNDYLVNLLISVTEVIFFFNPFALLLIHSIKKERENSCDDLVMQFRYDSCTYASALLSLETARNNHPQLAMAAVGKSNKMLLQRIMRITGHENVSRDNKPRLVLFVLIAITAAFTIMIKPQEVVTNFIEKIYTNSTAKPVEVQLVSYKTENNSYKNSLKKPAKKKSKPVKENIEQDKDMAYENVDFVSTNEEVNDPDNNEVLNASSVSPQSKDYSLAQGDASATVAPQAYSSSQNAPYVPSTSFSYNEVEDNSIPKHSIAQISKEAVDASQALQKVLKTMNGASLKKIARKTYITRKDITSNIEKLQCELQKCAEQLNSDKIKKDIDQALSKTDEFRLEKDLELQVQTLQSLNNASSAKAKRLSQDILKQQIKLQQADLKKQQDLIKKLEELNKKLKIVYI